MCIAHQTSYPVGGRGSIVTFHVLPTYHTKKTRQTWVVVRRTNAAEWISWLALEERQGILGKFLQLSLSANTC